MRISLPTTPAAALAWTVPLLAVLYAAGAAWAVAADLGSLVDALVNGTVVNAPLLIIGAQVLGAAVALRAGRPRAGAALTLLACTASLAAVAFDGDLGQAGLDGAKVAYQVTISVATLVTWCLAAMLVARPSAASRRRA